MDKEEIENIEKREKSQVEMLVNERDDSGGFLVDKSELTSEASKSYSNSLDHLYDQYETNANSNKKQQTNQLQIVPIQKKKEQPRLIQNSNQSEIKSFSLDSQKKNQLHNLYIQVQKQNNILSLDKQLQNQINLKREESEKEIQKQKLIQQLIQVKQQQGDIKKFSKDLNISSIVVIQKSSLQGKKQLFEVLLLSEVPEKFKKSVEIIQQTDIKAVLRFNFSELPLVSKQEIDQFIQLLYRKKETIQKYVFEIKISPQNPFYLIERIFQLQYQQFHFWYKRNVIKQKSEDDKGLYFLTQKNKQGKLIENNKKIKKLYLMGDFLTQNIIESLVSMDFSNLKWIDFDYQIDIEKQLRHKYLIRVTEHLIQANKNSRLKKIQYTRYIKSKKQQLQQQGVQKLQQLKGKLQISYQKRRKNQNKSLDVDQSMG